MTPTILNERDLQVGMDMGCPLPEYDLKDLQPLEAMIESDPMLYAALDELARKEHALLALQAQAQIEDINREFKSFNAVDGMGEVRRVMPAFAFHDIAYQMGGVECFADKDFNKYLDRKAPETRVRALGCKPGNGMALMVGWQPTERKFSKTYGDATSPRPSPPEAEREKASVGA